MLKRESEKIDVIQSLMNMAMSHIAICKWSHSKISKEHRKRSQEGYQKQSEYELHIGMTGIVCFGLNLFSIELSLKLTRLLYGLPYCNTHDLYRLYKDIRDSIDNSEELLSTVLGHINTMTSFLKEKRVSKKELEEMLESYRNTYRDIRYLYVDVRGNSPGHKKLRCFLKLNEKETIFGRDFRVLRYIAEAFISINENKMREEGIPLTKGDEIQES
ncbi:MAG: hypothetical protein OXH16_19560 [Gemmatimonadetes bacterium]|nr:hypothetical protein [Gemmatimonadota bacterium]